MLWTRMIWWRNGSEYHVDEGKCDDECSWEVVNRKIVKKPTKLT